MPDNYRHFYTNTAHRTMTVIFDNFEQVSDVDASLYVEEYLSQQEVETLTDEEFSYFLAHGSLDTDAEVY